MWVLCGSLLLAAITVAGQSVPIPFNETLTATLTEADQHASGEYRHTYFFEAQAGDVIRVRGEPVGTMLAYIRVTTPDDDELLRATPQFSPEIQSEGVTLQQDGTYTLTVAQLEPGAYDLHLIRRETPHLERDKSSYREYLYARVDQLEYTFDGTAGEQVILSTEAPTLDVLLDVYGPDGVLLASDDDSGRNFNARLGPLTLPGDGVYRFVLRAYADDGAGNIFLDLEFYDPSRHRVTPDEPLTLSLEPDPAPQSFLIEGQQGDVWALRSARLDELDIQLSGYDPLETRRQGENYRPGDYAYMALGIDRTYRLIVWFEDLDAAPIELTVAQVATNALDNATLEVALSRKTPSRTLVFQTIDHANASGTLRIEQIEWGETPPIQVEMELNGETFLAYTLENVVGMTTLQATTKYNMPDAGLASVTLSLLGDVASDAPVRFNVTNVIVQGIG